MTRACVGAGSTDGRLRYISFWVVSNSYQYAHKHIHGQAQWMLREIKSTRTDILLHTGES